MDWESCLEKKTIQKIEKSENQSEMAGCEQKTTSEKPNFCSNTVFSLDFKTRAKNFAPQKHWPFHSIFCFCVTKIINPI